MNWLTPERDVYDEEAWLDHDFGLDFAVAEYLRAAGEERSA